jgi:hypothetical protein
LFRVNNIKKKNNFWWMNIKYKDIMI